MLKKNYIKVGVLGNLMRDEGGGEGEFFETANQDKMVRGLSEVQNTSMTFGSIADSPAC